MVMAAGVSIGLEGEGVETQNRESAEQSRYALNLSGGDLADNSLIKPLPALKACHKSFIVTLVSSISLFFLSFHFHLSSHIIGQLYSTTATPETVQ